MLMLQWLLICLVKEGELYISTLETLHSIPFVSFSFQIPKVVDSGVGEPGMVLVVGSGGEARKG